MPITAETYERVALEDPEGRWELVCGQLVSRGPVTTEHAWVSDELHLQLQLQIDHQRYRVRSNASRLWVSTGNHYVPDVAVIPLEVVRRLLTTPGTFEVYSEAMPFVAEVWSPSTGGYDAGTKLAEYQRRGDLEIWLIHPYNRDVRVYRLVIGDTPDTSRYGETVHSGGTIALAALPNVSIAMDRLFP